MDGLVAVLWCPGLEAEAQPAVVGIDERASGAGIRGPLGLECGDLGALAGDAGDDRHLVADRLDIEPDEVDLLFLGQEGSFAGVAEDDQALDAFDGGQPAGQAGVRLIVEVAVGLEGGDRGRVHTPEVHGGHRALL